jgi:hypothetical protein
MLDSTLLVEVAQLHTEIDSLKARLANLTERLTDSADNAELIAEAAAPRESRTDRRGLLKAAGAASVGFIGVGLVTAAPAAAATATATATSYGGLYKGTCVDNADPLNLGRIKATVPAVYGSATSGWALPSYSVGSTQVPETNEEVWIAFEGANRSFPVWIGVFGAAPPT